MVVLLIIVGALMLIGLVILHELGHFLAARRAGVEVEEFGIGFPPKAKVLGKKNGTEYTLNWLPLGGFVRLKGEHDADTAKGTFGAARLRDKVKIMMAGVAVNLLLAIGLLSIVAAAGLPQVLGDDQFRVESDSTVSRHDVVLSVLGDNEEGFETPASNAGLEDGDTVLSMTPIACQGTLDCTFAIQEAADISGYTSSQAGQDVEIEYIDRTDKQTKTTVAQFRSEETVESSRVERQACIDGAAGNADLIQECPRILGYFGVIPNDYIERKATWSAPIVAAVFSAQIIQETLSTFGTIFSELSRGTTDAAEENLVGVIGIGYVLGEIADRGLIAVIFLSGVISLSLALMNALPIPALDGGRLFVTLLFRTIKKPLTQDLEERIHGTGFAALMLLFVVISFLDVQRFIFT